MSVASPIRFIPQHERTTSPCYICGCISPHPYWDPECNGYVCEEDIGAMLLAESALTSTKGISRPHETHSRKAGKSKKRKTKCKRKQS